MGHLVFIDTNIFLDFYRATGRDTRLSLLEHMDGFHDRIITSGQVEMEFKKNRQRVIRAALSAFKNPNWDSLPVPSFLNEAKAAEILSKLRADAKIQRVRLERKIEAVLKNPTRNDPVYRIVQRLFRSQTAVNLCRDNDMRFRVRRLARKRFVLGYPPRKGNDTSIGDAINWEWIIQCGSACADDIVIVSRDTDFGDIQKGDGYMNDWLGQEFRERVSRKRKVTLTPKLAQAFKLAGIKVTKKEVQDEEDLIEKVGATPQAPALFEGAGNAVLRALRAQGTGTFERTRSE